MTDAESVAAYQKALAESWMPDHWPGEEPGRDWALDSDPSRCRRCGVPRAQLQSMNSMRPELAKPVKSLNMHLHHRARKSIYPELKHHPCNHLWLCCWCHEAFERWYNKRRDLRAKALSSRVSEWERWRARRLIACGDWYWRCARYEIGEEDTWPDDPRDAYL